MTLKRNQILGTIAQLFFDHTGYDFCVQTPQFKWE